MLTEYVYVLARIAVADRQLFLQLVSATAATQNVSEALVWEPILNQWWQRVRLLSPPPSLRPPRPTLVFRHPLIPLRSSTTCRSRATGS